MQDLEGSLATPVRPRVRHLHLVPLIAVALSPVAAAGQGCTCGHTRTAHQHYRRGTDCAVCNCGRYTRPVLRRLLALGR